MTSGLSTPPDSEPTAVPQEHVYGWASGRSGLGGPGALGVALEPR